MTAALDWTSSRPLGTLFAGALSTLVLARYGIGFDGLIAAFTCAVLVVLSVIDFESHKLPNRIVLPAVAIVLIAHLATAPEHWQAWVGASLGAFACFFVIALVYPAGLGMGDVKLMLLLGAALGGAILPALMIGTLAAAAAGLFFLSREGRSARRRTIPFGPFLSFGAIAAMLLLTP